MNSGLHVVERKIAEATSGVDMHDFFFRDRPSRILLEGGCQNDWKRIHLDLGEFVIPEGTERIHPGTDYDLDLIARMNPEGRMERVAVQPQQAFEINYNFFLRINRPRGILVEDGRLFYDLSLLVDQPDLATNFLRYLAQEYLKGRGFHQIYQEIQSRNPQ